jgi:hypothetical protein
MKIRHLMTALTLICGFAHVSTAATTETRGIARYHASTRGEAGWLPSVSLGFGHMDQGGNSDVDGDNVSLQLLGTYNFVNSNWLADAGIGFEKQYFKDADDQPFVGLLTLGARYDFRYGWTLGPVVDVIIGNSDVYGTANNYLAMAGVVGMKEIYLRNDQMLRLGLKYTTEVGITNQTSSYLGLQAQWAIGSQNSYIQTSSL